jgi:plastocyanin
MRSFTAALSALIAIIGLTTQDVVPARAQDAAVTIEISVKNHKFEPVEIKAPAGKAITLKVKNLDSTPMEFESKPLRIEKVIAGNSEATINVRAQKAGRYKFFDEYNEKTAQGTLIVE